MEDGRLARPAGRDARPPSQAYGFGGVGAVSSSTNIL
jgi:hypothetical protein